MRLRHVILVAPFIFATCVVHAIPEPRPEPIADPEAFPEAQSYVNNAPFSGAIYVVNPNGQPVQGSCPAQASLNCGDQGHPSWCCPAGCSCVQQQNANGYVGCCPAGSNCAGTVASVQTITVTAQAAQTVVNVQQYTTTYQPVPNTQPAAAGFCQTLTMDGPGLPAVTQGQCGTILIVSGSSTNWRTAGMSALGISFTIQLAIARMFRWL